MKEKQSAGTMSAVPDGTSPDQAPVWADALLMRAVDEFAKKCCHQESEPPTPIYFEKLRQWRCQQPGDTEFRSFAMEYWISQIQFRQEALKKRDGIVKPIVLQPGCTPAVVTGSVVSALGLLPAAPGPTSTEVK